MGNKTIGALAEDNAVIRLDGADMSGFDIGAISRNRAFISAVGTKFSAPPQGESWWRSYWVAVMSGITVIAVGGIVGLLW